MSRYNSPNNGNRFNNPNFYSPNTMNYRGSSPRYNYSPNRYPGTPNQYSGTSNQYSGTPNRQPWHGIQYNSPNRGYRNFKNGSSYQQQNNGEAPIEAYFKPSMLEDPWEKLRRERSQKKENIDSSFTTNSNET